MGTQSIHPLSFPVLGYGCVSSAGIGVDSFWNGLLEGKDHSAPVPTHHWPVPPTFQPWAYRYPEPLRSRFSSALELLAHTLSLAWSEAKVGLRNHQPKRLGVLLASTKGCLEDWVWNSSLNPSLHRDPLTPVLESFLEIAQLEHVPTCERICISNACTSTLGALALGQRWLEQDRVDAALVLSADWVGPFVLQGFQSLRALCETPLMPFSENRSGLRIGEASTAIIIGKPTPLNQTRLEIGPIGIDAEGHSATRPNASGESLKRAFARAKISQDFPCDLIIAHGTGTLANDSIEDHVFDSLFGANQNSSVPVTSTKWSVGHTLGASASMDLIAAFKVLETKRLFKIENTLAVDPEMKSQILIHNTPISSTVDGLQSVGISSLGFGGIHSALRASLCSGESDL